METRKGYNCIKFGTKNMIERMELYVLKRFKHSFSTISYRYCSELTKSAYAGDYLQSLDMPTARHFLNLQYWQRFRLILMTKQLPSFRHLYSICF